MKVHIKKHIDNLKSSTDGKRLFQNFAYLSLLQVASFIFPLATMPYLARVIGVEGFGKIAFAAAVMVWIQTLTDWGFNYTATRDIAKSRGNNQLVSEIFTNVLYARLILMAISFLILVLMMLLIPKFSENSDILLVSFLMIPGHIIFPDWFFQAMEKMKLVTIPAIISKLIFTVFVFLFIHEKKDYIYQPLFVSIGYLVSGLYSMYLILYKWKIRILRPQYSDIARTIKNSSNVFVNTIVPNLYNSFSVVLLGFWGGSLANGKLDVGMKLTNICQTFISIVTRTFFPYLSRKTDYHSFYAKLSLLTAFAISAFLFVTSPFFIIILFTEEFSDSIIVMRICSVSLFFLTLSEVYGTNYLIVKGYERDLRKITVRGSLIGFFISFPLVYQFSYIGAAIVITVTRAILGVWTMKTAKKIIKQ